MLLAQSCWFGAEWTQAVLQRSPGLLSFASRAACRYSGAVIPSTLVHGMSSVVLLLVCIGCKLQPAWHDMGSACLSLSGGTSLQRGKTGLVETKPGKVLGRSRGRAAGLRVVHWQCLTVMRVMVPAHCVHTLTFDTRLRDCYWSLGIQDSRRRPPYLRGPWRLPMTPHRV